MSVSERKFGVLPTGETVKIYHLENGSGAFVEVTAVWGSFGEAVCAGQRRKTDRCSSGI